MWGKGLRKRLSARDIAYFKLALWSCLIVWMLFFLAFSIVYARISVGVLLSIYGADTWGQALAWICPIGIVFTALLIIVLMARYAWRKLR